MSPPWTVADGAYQQVLPKWSSEQSNEIEFLSGRPQVGCRGGYEEAGGSYQRMAEQQSGLGRARGERRAGVFLYISDVDQTHHPCKDTYSDLLARKELRIWCDSTAGVNMDSPTCPPAHLSSWRNSVFLLPTNKR